MNDDFTALSPAAIRNRVAAAGLGMRARARALLDEIDAHFRTAILTGALEYGDRVPPERSLAAQFGASRKTIQEVPTRLEQAGFVARRVGSGTFVTWRPEPASPGQLFPTPTVSPLDAIEARRVIEPSCSELVVARATEDDFERMATRLREMETARDQVAFKAAGYAFHLEVARATRNPLLVAMYEMLVAARAKAGWGTLIPLNDRREQRNEQIAGNRAIYEALRARDAERARALSDRNLSRMISTVATFPLNA